MFADQTNIPLPAVYVQAGDPAETWTDGRIQPLRLWRDISTGLLGTLKQRNADNDGWDTLIDLDVINRSVTTKTNDYTTIGSDDIIFLNSPTDKTLSLIAGASRGTGRPYYVKNINVGVWTIDPNGAEVIDGAAALNLAERDKVVIIWTGTAWETF